jgi:hypothetical protein
LFCGSGVFYSNCFLLLLVSLYIAVALDALFPAGAPAKARTTAISTEKAMVMAWVSVLMAMSRQAKMGSAPELEMAISVLVSQPRSGLASSVVQPVPLVPLGFLARGQAHRTHKDIGYPSDDNRERRAVWVHLREAPLVPLPSLQSIPIGRVHHAPRVPMLVWGLRVLACAAVPPPT